MSRFGSFIGIYEAVTHCRRHQTSVWPRNAEKAEAPLGESGASLRKLAIGRGDLLPYYVCETRKKSSEQQRRLSGVCSLGGVAVELDRQFPSTDMCVRLGKRFNTEQLNLLPGVFSATPESTQPSGGPVFRIGRGGGQGRNVAGSLKDDLRPQ